MNDTNPSATRSLGAIAARLSCTEGQVYTMAIGLAFAILLAMSVPSALGGTALVAAARPAAPAAGPVAGSGVPSATAPYLTPPGDPLPPTYMAGLSLPGAAMLPEDSSWDDSPPSEPSDDSPSDASTTPPEEPKCPATEGVRPIVDALGQTGVVPDHSMRLLLARITGCSTNDPVVLLIGALAETGEGLPDPGPRVPGVPVAPPEVPQEIVDAVQPFREAIDPMCDVLGDVTTVFFFGFSTWPAGIDQVLMTPVRQALLVCGQLRI